jgi:muramoyltetrapeptide carboxypeptidase
MLKPRRLRHGDRLALVAPASPFPRHEFDAGVAELKALGFEPVFDDRLFERDGFVAGSPAVRAGSIVEAWRDPEISALIAVRGGYGSVQVLPLLDPKEAAASRKAFVGYSDVTSLQMFLVHHAGLVCFHGPMVADRFGRPGTYDRDSFLRTLMRPEPAGPLVSPGMETVREGEATGRLFGGNLAVLVASLGTPFAFAPPSDGYLLFLDEVGERPIAC